MRLGLLIIGVPARSASVTLSTKWRKSRSTGFSPDWHFAGHFDPDCTKVVLVDVFQKARLRRIWCQCKSEWKVSRTVQKLCWLGLSTELLTCWASIRLQANVRRKVQPPFTTQLYLFLLGQNCLSLIFNSFKICLCCSIRWRSFRPSLEVT